MCVCHRNPYKERQTMANEYLKARLESQATSNTIERLIDLKVSQYITQFELLFSRWETDHLSETNMRPLAFNHFN